MPSNKIKPWQDLPDPIFIVGSPRSGTTLLQCMLSAHPELYSLPETHYFCSILPEANLTANSMLNDLSVSQLIDRLGKKLTCQWSAQAKMDLRKYLHDHPVTAGDLFRWLLFTFQPHRKATSSLRPVEKTPYHVFYLKELRCIFPGSQILHIVRDPRDVVSSRLQMPSTSHLSLQQLTRDWIRCNQAAETFSLQFPGSIHTLKYENLVLEPEKELMDIGKFLCLRYSPAMVNKFSRQYNQCTIPAEKAWKQELKGGHIQNKHGIWRERLTADQAEGITTIASSAMKKYQYFSPQEFNMKEHFINGASLRQRERSADKLSSYKNKHRGERCVIIGNGPSLKEMDLSALKNEITFGLNRIYLGFDQWKFRPTYYVSVNSLVLEQHAGEILQEIKAPKFISQHGRPYFPANREDIIFLESQETPYFTKDPGKGIWEGYTVTFVAMQLAYYMGFDEVILIGVDHNFVTNGPANAEVISQGDDQNHFAKDYFGKGARWHLPDLHNSEMAYRLANFVYQRNGRRILDATVNGKLTVFPKVDFEKVFQKTDPSSRHNPPLRRQLKAEEPIVVYQMGKVGSSSITESILATSLPNPVYQVHYLTDQGLKRYKNLPTPPDHVKSSVQLKTWMGENREKKALSYITLVRDPVSRNVSAFFQNLDTWVSRDELLSLNSSEQIERLRTVFLEEYPHEIPLTWWKEELEAFTGFDVYQVNFPHQQGFQIYSKAEQQLMIIRTEDIDRVGSAALNMFLGQEDLHLKKKNTASQKWYQKIYQTFCREVVLPDQYLDRFYSSPYANHFYTQPELEKFRSHWAKKGSLVTVIIPWKEESDVLESCLDHLSSQTIADRLNILICSQHLNTRENTLDPQNWPGFGSISLVETGPEREADAWNRGLFHSNSPYLTLIRPGEGLREDALEQMTSVLESNPQRNFCYGHFCISPEKISIYNPEQCRRRIQLPDFQPEQLLFYPVKFPHPLWRQSVFEQMGIFDNRYQKQHLYEFQLRTTVNGGKGILIPEYLSQVNQSWMDKTEKDSLSQKEHQNILNLYRSTVKIQQIFPMPNTNHQHEARAWTVLGNTAVRYQIPGEESASQDLRFALDCYQKALKTDPTCYPAFHNMITVLCSLGQWAAANNLLEQSENGRMDNLRQAVLERRLLPLERAILPNSGENQRIHPPDIYAEDDPLPNKLDSRDSSQSLHTLQRILDADEPGQELRESRRELNYQVLDLLQETIRETRASGKEELADGLENLAEYMAALIQQ